MVGAAAASVDPRAWHRAFRDLPREHGFEPLRVEGAIPKELAGTLMRVGPSLFASHGRPYGHWFDGDGAITAFRIDGAAGRAEGASRLLDTADRRRELAAGRPLMGGYGTRGPSWWRRFGGHAKHVGNTNLLWWKERLFALYEAGPPIEVDPRDLRTIGETDLDGLLTHNFAAHPHHLPGRRATYNFAVVYGRVTNLEIYEFQDPEAGGAARRLTSFPLPWPTLIHDFIATEDHLIFLLPPLRLRTLRQYLGFGYFDENLVWEPERGAIFLVVPIDDPSRPILIPCEPCFTWHFANAFVEGGDLAVDLVRYPDFGTDRWLIELLRGGPSAPPTGTFFRARLDLERRRVAWEERWPRLCEFPTIAGAVAGRPYRYVYMAAHSSPAAGAAGMQDRLVRLDVERGEAIEVEIGPGHYPSEAIFVPRPGAAAEDDGHLLTLVYDAGSDRSHLAIVDAARLAEGPLARLWLDHHVPFTFHGTWIGET